MLNDQPSQPKTAKQHLVGGLNPSEKYQSIDDDIPNIWEHKSHVPVTTNQWMDAIHCMRHNRDFAILSANQDTPGQEQIAHTGPSQHIDPVLVDSEPGSDSDVMNTTRIWKKNTGN